MAPNRYYSSTAVPTTLAAALSAVSPGASGNVELTAFAGYPSQYPFTIDVDLGTATPEVITITQAPAGSGPYVFSNCVRGDDGTTPYAHTTTAVVTHGTSARDFQEPQNHLGSTSNVHGVTGVLAGLASPAFTGTPTAPTPGALTSSTQLATTAYADAAVAVETARAEAAESSKATTAFVGTAVATETARAETAEASAAAAVAAETARAEAAEALKAPLASAALTGTPTAPTASPLTSSTQLATTAYADSAVGALLTGAVYSGTVALTDTALAIWAVEVSTAGKLSTLPVMQDQSAAPILDQAGRLTE
jgi:hypothetical protein